MNTKKHGRREEIRYSEAFKMEVVRELEAGGLAFEDIAMKYGINGKGTVPRWVRQYGNGTRGKVIRVESPWRNEPNPSSAVVVPLSVAALMSRTSRDRPARTSKRWHSRGS